MAGHNSTCEHSYPISHKLTLMQVLINGNVKGVGLGLGFFSQQ